MAAGEVYEIDIQASLANGADADAKLNALTSSIGAAEKSAQFFAAAMKQTSAAMAAAKAASAGVAEELSASQAQYRELEKNADRAAKAVEKAAVKGAVPDDVAAQATQARAALDAYSGSLREVEKRAAGAAANEQALAKFMGHLKDSADEAKAPLDAAKQQAEAYEKLRGSLAALPGPLGKVASAALAPAQGFQKLAGGVGASRAAMILGGVAAATFVVALVALAAAVVTATVKIAAWAVGLADANRKTALATEAFNAMNPALAGLDFAALTAETGQSAASLQSLAKSLQGAGVTADGMGKALRVAALASTALGDGAAQEYVQLEAAAGAAQKAVDDAAKAGGVASKAQVEALAKARAAASDFASTAQSKLGGVVARHMLGLEAQAERFKSNIGGLFGGLDIEPVLKGLAKLVALFDKNTAAGAALQFLFEKVFQPIINQADTAATVVEAFYLGVMIGAMKLYIALKPTIKAIEEFFGLDSGPLEINFQTITKVGEALAPVFAAIALVVGGTLAVAFTTVAAIIAAQVAVWYGLWKAIKFVYDSVAVVVGALVTLFSGLGSSLVGVLQAGWKAVTDFFAGVSLVEIGRNLMLGLAQGITGAVGAVVSAVTNAVSGTIAAAKSALGIHSPSKVFAEIGDYTGQGFAGGIEAATPQAHEAVQVMASPTEALDQAALSGDVAKFEALQGVDAAAAPVPAAAPATPAAAASAPTAKAPPAVHIENLTIEANDREGGQAAADGFFEQLTALIEGDAAQAAGAF